MPNQKAGKATPDTEKTRITWSSQLSRRTAESTPSETPNRIPIDMLTKTSSRVAGAKRNSSVRTGCRETIETPRSPRRRPPK